MSRLRRVLGIGVGFHPGRCCRDRTDDRSTGADREQSADGDAAEETHRAQGGEHDHRALRSGWQGLLGTAIVQMAYLGHGDAGLLANLQMALLFSVIGSVVTVAYLFLARTWSRRRLGGWSRA